MGDFLRYDHFDRLDAAVAVITREGEVLYRNAAALRLAKAFRTGGRLLSYFERGESAVSACLKKRKTTLERIVFPGGRAHSVLLVPDRSPEGERVILLLTPLLEGELGFARASGSYVDGQGSAFEPAVKGTAELPAGKALTPFGAVLLNAYAQLPRSLCCFDGEDERFTVGGGCLFLNRLFSRLFAARRIVAAAKCTADCADMPLSRMRELSACLAYLSVLLAVNAGSLEVVFSCEKERAHVLFTAPSKGRLPEGRLPLADLFPGRREEFSILEALFELLSYDLDVRVIDGAICVELACRTRFPAQYFKAPTDAERTLEALRVEELLSGLGAVG